MNVTPKGFAVRDTGDIEMRDSYLNLLGKDIYFLDMKFKVIDVRVSEEWINVDLQHLPQFEDFLISMR